MKLYKIIQLLRLSRLVLLVILLLFAVIAKIARAEFAMIFANHTSEYVYPSARAACEAIGAINPPGSDNYSGGICINPDTGKYAGAFTAITKSCDAKELTHNGVSDGIDGTPEDLHWLRAPEGIDAGDWYSDKFTTCENNCLVSNTRKFFEPSEFIRPDRRSITEDNGVSRSLFYKRQTGAVCVPQKKKADDPPKPPAPDAGDSADGSSGSDTGNANGQNNGQGSQGEGNGSSGSGEGSQNNQGSGNSDEGGSGSGGSGGGSGGVNGSGGQTGPSGGGTGGGENGGSEGSGSEGEAGGESDGSGEESGGSGDSGGQGGADSGGQGQVGGTEDDSGEAGGHYFPCPSGKGSYKKGTEPSAECLGDGKGEGSIGGGSCEADTPPDCKGDPIQCYIAREQWRTACAASGKSNKVEGDGNCGTQTPPECKGDATQCYIVKQQFLEGCARQALEVYGREQAGKAQSYLEGDGFDNIGKDLEDNDTTVKLPNQLNTSGYGFTRSCPTLQFDINVALFGSFQLDFSVLCGLANLLGNLFVAISLVLSARYILR